MAAHRYWRVNCLHSMHPESGGNVGFAELSMAAMPAGPNLLTGGIVSAIGADGSNPATAASDGNPSTSWNYRPNNVWPAWWQYEFSAPVEIVEVTMLARTDAPTTSPDTWNILFSDDGVTFTDSGRGTIASQPWTAGMTQTFNVAPLPPPPAGTHWIWRLNILTSTFYEPPLGDCGFAELSMASVAGGPNVLTGGVASAIGADGSNPFLAVLDGNPSTSWNWRGPPGWWQYQFAAPVGVAEVKITARNDGAPTTAPATWELQYSDDASTFTTTGEGVITSQPWTAGMTQTFAVDGGITPARTRRRPVVILQ